MTIVYESDSKQLEITSLGISNSTRIWTISTGFRWGLCGLSQWGRLCEGGDEDRKIAATPVGE